MNKIDLQFPESRYKHCHSVGKKMYAYAREVLGWSEAKCQEMFVLGCIHDVGYELYPTMDGHSSVLAHTLDGYKYSKEISRHSRLCKNFRKELDLLYYADATVDSEGNWCTYAQRLQDVKDRYGEDSTNYKQGESFKEYLMSKGFDDKFEHMDS